MRSDHGTRTAETYCLKFPIISFGLSKNRRIRLREAFRECGRNWRAAEGWKVWCIILRCLRLQITKRLVQKMLTEICIDVPPVTFERLKSMNLFEDREKRGVPYCMKPKLKFQPINSLIIGIRALRPHISYITSTTPNGAPSGVN